MVRLGMEKLLIFFCALQFLFKGGPPVGAVQERTVLTVFVVAFCGEKETRAGFGGKQQKGIGKLHTDILSNATQ